MTIKNAGEIVELGKSVESVEHTLHRIPDSSVNVANDKCELPTKTAPLLELSDVFVGCLGFIVMMATIIACGIFITKYVPALEKDSFGITIFIAVGVFKGMAQLFAYLRYKR